MTRNGTGSEVDLSPPRECHCLAALAQMGPTPIPQLADVLGLERTTLARSAGVMEVQDRVTEERERRGAGRSPGERGTDDEPWNGEAT